MDRNHRDHADTWDVVTKPLVYRRSADIRERG
jgi:hypothetical protein